jgi:hypothetical protein
MNKRKSAVAVTRKMVSLAWLLMKRRDMELGFGKEAALLQNKKNGGKRRSLLDKIT